MIYLFSLNNQLPRILEVVNAIITVEPTVLSCRKGIPESLNYCLSYKEKYPEQVPKTAEDYSDYVDIFPDKKRLQNKGLTRLYSKSVMQLKL